MPDEHPPGVRIAGEQPSIPVGTAVNLSGPNGPRGICSMLHSNHSSRGRSATAVVRGGFQTRRYMPKPGLNFLIAAE